MNKSEIKKRVKCSIDRILKESHDRAQSRKLENSRILKEIHSFLKMELMNENLILKRHGSKIYAISDDPEDSKKAFKDRETVKNKETLKRSGFSFDGTAWYVYSNKLRQAQEIIASINKVKIEKFIDTVEDLPEFMAATDDFSKKNELATKIDTFLTALSDEVESAAASQEFQKYLTFSAKFRTYSANNLMLIYIQNKNATRLMGFRKWNTLHRHVKKGAKAIFIYAPITIKPDEFKAGDDSGLDDAVKSKIIGFRPVPVYDIADTEATDSRGEVPSVPTWHGSNTPDEKADKLFELVTKLAENLGINLERSDAQGGEQGWARGDHINITSGVAGVGATGTIIHEIAHSLMHFKESSPFFIHDQELSKEAKEWQAESVSYVVLKNYDLPAQHHSMYLALWKANKDALKSNLDIIRKVSSFIIDELDKIVKNETRTTTTT